VCAYLLWAKVDKLTLKFNVPDQAYDYCSAVGDGKLYGVSYGLDDLWKLGSFEFMEQLVEFVDVLYNGHKFHRKEIFAKYFKVHYDSNLLKSIKPPFPKFIHYAAHAETLAQFFDGLELHKIDRSPAGSALFIEFIKVHHGEYEFKEGVHKHEYFVRAFFKPNVT
jgi:hypothetical protein